MSFSMAPLLMYSPDVPANVRDELRAAYAADPGQRTELLISAARMLHQELGLDCSDVRELVGLG